MQVFNYVTLFQPNYETETESIANPEEFDKEIDPNANQENDEMEEGEDIEHFEDRVLNKRAAKVWTNLLKLIRGLLKNQT